MPMPGREVFQLGQCGAGRPPTVIPAQSHRRCRPSSLAWRSASGRFCTRPRAPACCVVARCLLGGRTTARGSRRISVPVQPDPGPGFAPCLRSHLRARATCISQAWCSFHSLAWSRHHCLSKWATNAWRPSPGVRSHCRATSRAGWGRVQCLRCDHAGRGAYRPPADALQRLAQRIVGERGVRYAGQAAQRTVGTDRRGCRRPCSSGAPRTRLHPRAAHLSRSAAFAIVHVSSAARRCGRSGICSWREALSWRESASTSAKVLRGPADGAGVVLQAVVQGIQARRER